MAVKGESILGLSGLISLLVGLILRSWASVLAVEWLIGILAILGIFQLLLGLKFHKIGTGSKN